MGSIDFHGNTEVQVEVQASALATNSRIRVFGGWDVPLPPTDDRLLVPPQEIAADTPWTMFARRIEEVGTYFRVQVVIESLEDESVRTFQKQQRKGDGDFDGGIPVRSRKTTPAADVS